MHQPSRKRCLGRFSQWILSFCLGVAVASLVYAILFQSAQSAPLPQIPITNNPTSNKSTSVDLEHNSTPSDDDIHREFPSASPANSRCAITFDAKLACSSLRSYKQQFGRDPIMTPLLQRLCIKRTFNIESCALPRSMRYSEPLRPLSVPALRQRLKLAGTADCVSGPVSPDELTRKFFEGPLGSPTWSVYRKSCEGRYRELTRLEVFSVLYHHAKSTALGSSHSRGIAIHGDSMPRNFAHRVVCFLRGSGHCVDRTTSYLYVLRTTHDEVLDLIPCSSHISFAAEESAKARMAVPTRCVLSTHFPGYLPMRLQPANCGPYVQGILLVMLVTWGTYPETPHYNFLKRLALPPVNFLFLAYWWNPVKHEEGIEKMTESLLEFEEKQYASVTSSFVASPPRGTTPMILFFCTAPGYRSGFVAPVDKAILPIEQIVARNKYLRSLAWHSNTSFSPEPLVGAQYVGASYLHRYLLDFDAIAVALSDVGFQRDHAHFTCSNIVFVYTEGFFCADSVNYVTLQWLAHIIADEVVTHL